MASSPLIQWHKEYRKIIVLYSNTPQHELTCTNEAKTITRAEVITKPKARGIAVVWVSLGNGPERQSYAYGCHKRTIDWLKAPRNQAKEISERTGGAHIVASKSLPRKVDTRNKILELMDDSKVVVKLEAETSCDAGIKVQNLLAFPRTARPGTTLSFKQRVTVNPEICSIFSGSCKTTFFISGPLLERRWYQAREISVCGSR